VNSRKHAAAPPGHADDHQPVAAPATLAEALARAAGGATPAVAAWLAALAADQDDARLVPAEGDNTS
jgi:hypothetical protein